MVYAPEQFPVGITVKKSVADRMASISLTMILQTISATSCSERIRKRTFWIFPPRIILRTETFLCQWSKIWYNVDRDLTKADSDMDMALLMYGSGDIEIDDFALEMAAEYIGDVVFPDDSESCSTLFDDPQQADLMNVDRVICENIKFE